MTVGDELSELVDARQKTANKKKVIETVAELIHKSNIDLEDIGRIDKITLGTYQALTKDADGEAHIHEMERAAVVLSPKWADGPEWPVVGPASAYGAPIKEALCLTCSSLLRAIQSGSLPIESFVTRAIESNDTQPIQSDFETKSANAGHPNLSARAPSVDTTSPPKRSRRALKAKEASVPSVAVLSPGDKAPGTSTTTTLVVPKTSGAVANACVVCSAPVVMLASGGTSKSTTKPSRATSPALLRKWKTAVVLPDPQIGYRRLEGELEPFHDEAAITAALAVVAEVQPNRIINLGDTLDLPEWGRFLKEAAFFFTTQPTIEYGHTYLARQRAAAPGAEIDMLEGNHDFRLVKGVVENALAAFGLKQAGKPESWPVLSVPHLLRLDELGVNYVAGYPAGEVWINDNLRCIHGIKVRSNGSTASAVVNDENVSTIFGHVHRLELQHRTRHTRSGPRRMFAATPGCLCRVDGSVPSVKSGTDLLGRPLTTWENWQQGLAVVHYVDGDGPHSIELVEIQDGVAHFRGDQVAAA